MEKEIRLILMIAVLMFSSAKAQTIIKLHCSDCTMFSISSDEKISECKNDVLKIEINDDQHSVNIKSQSFGFNVTFSNNWTYNEYKENTKLSDGRVINFYVESYIAGKGKFITYARPAKGEYFFVETLLQICVNENAAYSFSIEYGEVYDSIRKEWVKGDFLVDDPWTDRVRMFLRWHIGHKFCSNFDEYERLEDSLRPSNSDNPWDR